MTSSMFRTVPSRAAKYLAVTLALSGCAAQVKERHYFATYQEDSPGEPVNFFRVDVTANTRFTNARYVAGYYDERAVDLFFSELKSNDTASLFSGELKDPGTDQVIKPLDPGVNGALVMVLSTNADDIVDAISAFAESQVVGQAVTQIANGSRLRDSRLSKAAAGPQKATAAAFAAELTTLAQAAGDATTTSDAERLYLRLLQRLATESGGRGAAFESFAEALAWFQTTQRASGSEP